MSVTIVPTYHNDVGNKAMSIIGLMDQFFGPTAKQNKATLENTKQQGVLAAAAGQREAEMHGPTLATAASVAQEHAIAAKKAGLDQANTDAYLATIKHLPAEELGTPFSALSPEAQQRHLAAFQTNGGNDPGTYAKAYSTAASAISSRLPTPPNSFVTGGTTDSSGNIAGQFATLPDISQFGFGTTPPAPVDASQTNAFSAGQGPVASKNPAPVSATAPDAAPQIPDLTPQQFLNPFLRSWHEAMIESAQKKQGLQKGAQELTAGARTATMGTPDEQTSAGKITQNAQAAFADLNELRKTVQKFGNYESGNWSESKEAKKLPEQPGGWFGNPRASAKLDNLPKRIAAEIRNVQNPTGAPLKPGQAEPAAENVISMPEHSKLPTLQMWYNVVGPSNDKTIADIDEQQKALVKWVKNYEDLPTTRLPIVGLDPETRKLIGKTKFGAPDNEIFQAEADSGVPQTAQPQTLATQQEFEAFKKANPKGTPFLWGPTGVAGKL